MKQNLDNFNEIVMLGDSLIEWFRGSEYKNLGCAGYTTRDLTWYLEDYSEISGKLGILLIGVNDILSDFEKEISEKYYTEIMKILQKRFEKILIIKLLPTDIVTINKKIKLFNSFIDFSYKEIENIFILDVYNNFLNYDNKEKNIINKYTIDGIHLSNNGYELFKKLLEEKVNNILKI